MAKSSMDVVTQYVLEQMQLHHIPGAAVAVLDGERPLLASAYGVADLERGHPVSAESVFEICSISKQFTAAATLMLVDRGLLRLGDQLGMIMSSPPESWKPITIQHLLTASSGIKDYVNDVDDPRTPIRAAPNELLEYVASLPLNFPPGEKWSYSNTGYVLLAVVIERCTGARYEDFLASQILGPLGLSHTFRNDLKDIVPGRVCGYEFLEATWINRRVRWAGKATSGDGELLSTLSDLIVWTNSWSTHRLLSQSTTQTALTPATSDNGGLLQTNLSSHYGFGWFIGEHRGHRVHWTPGAGEGFSTTLMRFPSDGISVVVLTNIRQFLLADEIARGIAERVW